MSTNTQQIAADLAPSSVHLAMAVLTERVQSLPADDRSDLAELTGIWLDAESKEERNSARKAIEELLDNAPAGVSRMEIADGPQGELKEWVSLVSHNIKEKRKAAGLTQQRLAETSGLPQSHISRLENGEHSPSFATLERIAGALGIPISELNPDAH